MKYTKPDGTKTKDITEIKIHSDKYLDSFNDLLDQIVVDILENDNDVVDDEEFENLKRQEGCNNFQQEMRFKIIGTQLFQKVER